MTPGYGVILHHGVPTIENLVSVSILLSLSVCSSAPSESSRVSAEAYLSAHIAWHWSNITVDRFRFFCKMMGFPVEACFEQ